jgi:hypothetical protein
MHKPRRDQGEAINAEIYEEEPPREHVSIREEGTGGAIKNDPSQEAHDEGEESWDDEIDLSDENLYRNRAAWQPLQEEDNRYHEEDIQMAMREIRAQERDREREHEYYRRDHQPYTTYDAYQDDMIRRVEMQLREARRDKQDLEREIDRLAHDGQRYRQNSEQDLQLVRLKTKIARLQAQLEEEEKEEKEREVRLMKEKILQLQATERNDGASRRQARRPAPSMNFENYDQFAENELPDSDPDLDHISKPQSSNLQMSIKYNEPHVALQRLGLVDEIDSQKNISGANGYDINRQLTHQCEPKSGTKVEIVNIVGTMFNKAHQDWKLHLISTTEEDSKKIDFQWLRVQTESMVLDEFFDLAFKFPAKSDTQKELILNIQEKLEETKCNTTVHGNLLEPGTVLRSDEINPDSTKHKSESATFCCIPFCYFTRFDPVRVVSEKSYPEIPILQALHQFQSTESRDKEQMPQTLLNSISDLLVVGQVWCLLLPSGLITYSTGKLQSLFGSDLVISDIEKDNKNLDSLLVRVSTQSSRRFMKKVSRDCSLFELEAKIWADYQRYLRNSNKQRAGSDLEQSLNPLQWRLFEEQQVIEDHKGTSPDSGHRRHPMRTKFMEFHRQICSIKQDWNLKTNKSYFLDMSTTKSDPFGVQENIYPCPRSCKPLMYLLSDLPNPITKEPPLLTYESTEGARLSHNMECLMAKLPKAVSTARLLLLAQNKSVSFDSTHEADQGRQIMARPDLPSTIVRTFSDTEEPKSKFELEHGNKKEDAVSAEGQNNTKEPMKGELDTNSTTANPKVEGALNLNNSDTLSGKSQEPDLDKQSIAELLSWENAKLDEMIQIANTMAENVAFGSKQVLAYYLPENDESEFKVQYLTLLDSIMNVGENTIFAEKQY